MFKKRHGCAFLAPVHRALWTAIAVTVLMAASSSPVTASIVDAAQARNVATNWIAYLSAAGDRADGAQIQNPHVLANGDTLLGWAFPLTPRGYIVVSGLLELPPITAYSLSHEFDPTSPGGMETLVRDVLTDRLRRYAAAYGSLASSQPPTASPLLDSRALDHWELLSQEPQSFAQSLASRGTPTTRDAGPLLETSWHQGAPYNGLSPAGDGGQCLVGCVATAAAQIMRYYSWPGHGDGTHSYTWDGDQSCDGSVGGQLLSGTFSDDYAWADMPDSCDSGCSPAEEDALAELCYEVGVAFDMDYGVCASGAYTADALVVFPTWFHYSDEIDREDRDAHSASSWFDVVKAEVDQGRPMQYRIEGHSVVCDGWKEVSEQDFYHINYGWGGPNTAWFAVDNIANSPDPMDEFLIRYIYPEIATVEVVDDSVQVGLYSSLAVDDQGRLAVAYFDQGNASLKFSLRDGGWSTEFVDTGDQVGEYCALTIDSMGNRNLSYYDATHGALKYSGWLDGAWTAGVEVVDGAPGGDDVGRYSSLALDDQDRLSVSYYDGDNTALRFAVQDGAWQKETVDDLGNVGEYTAVAIDAAGRANISYYDASRGALKYSGWIDGMWTASTEVVDGGAGDDVGRYSSLMLDDQGDLAVSYYDVDNTALKFASKDGTWQDETVDDLGAVGEYSSLTIDAARGASISYYDSSRGALKYTGWIDGMWTAATEVVDGGILADVGRYSSLTLDGADRLAVSYYDSDNSALKLAVMDGTWQDETVDNVGSVGEYSSLSVDHSGRSSISYYDATRGALKYSGWITDMWTADVEIVDSGPTGEDVGRYSSLALDEQGDLAVTYYDATNQELRFAMNDGSWSQETVDDAAQVGQYASLCIDWLGRRNISYYDANMTALKYAGWLPPPTSVPSDDDDVSPGDSLWIPIFAAFHAPSPNPSRGLAALAYDVPSPGAPVAMAVYNAAGKEISRSELGFIPAGRYVLTWDGTDGHGGQVASGVYFFRMWIGDWMGSRKVTLIR